MKRYIDAYKIPYHDLSEGKGVCIIAFLEDVIKVPTANVRENIKGHWVKDRYCSVCDFDKKEYDYYSDWRENFCPNCGADMRGKK